MSFPRPRVSLLALMFVMTIVAMSVVLWKLNSQISPLRDEVLRLREQTGRLAIVDQTKIHAIALPEYQTLTWTYRVYLPSGRNYFAACKINDLPLGGVLPQIGSPPSISGKSYGKGNGMAMGLTPGEYLVTLVIFKDAQGDLRFSLNHRSLIFDPDGYLRDDLGGCSFSADVQWLPVQEGSTLEGIFGGVSEQMSVVAPDQPLVLLDFRTDRGKGRSADQMPDGAVVWIEPVP